MRILIAEDDPISRKFLFTALSPYGTCDLAVNGIEAVDAFVLALDESKPYNLVCLDIMMPKVDGIKALEAMRNIERQKGIKGRSRTLIIMITALSDSETVSTSIKTGCEAYISKPFGIEELKGVMERLGIAGNQHN